MPFLTLFDHRASSSVHIINCLLKKKYFFQVYRTAVKHQYERYLLTTGVDELPPPTMAQQEWKEMEIISEMLDYIHDVTTLPHFTGTMISISSQNIALPPPWRWAAL